MLEFCGAIAIRLIAVLVCLWYCLLAGCFLFDGYVQDACVLSIVCVVCWICVWLITFILVLTLCAFGLLGMVFYWLLFVGAFCCLYSLLVGFEGLRCKLFWFYIWYGISLWFVAFYSYMNLVWVVWFCELMYLVICLFVLLIELMFWWFCGLYVWCVCLGFLPTYYGLLIACLFWLCWLLWTAFWLFILVDLFACLIRVVLILDLLLWWLRLETLMFMHLLCVWLLFLFPVWCYIRLAFCFAFCGFVNWLLLCLGYVVGWVCIVGLLNDFVCLMLIYGMGDCCSFICELLCCLV